MIEYQIKGGDTFFVKFTDVIVYCDIINFLKEFKSLPNLPEKITLLYDLTDVDMDLTIDEIHMLSKYADAATENFTLVRTAFLVDKPKLAAYSMLFSEFNGNSRNERRIFSTHRAAEIWLNS